MNESSLDVCVDCGKLKPKVKSGKGSLRCRSCVKKLSYRDPEYRRRQSEAAKRRWSDPEQREKKSEANRRAWSDPESRQRRIDSLTEMSKDPEVKQRRSVALREAKRDPQQRQRQSDISRSRWSDPARRKQMSDLMEEIWSDQELRRRHSISMGGDGDLDRMSIHRDFRKWTKSVKERDGRRCQCCDSAENLHAHHIKPKALHPELAFDISNGITLCESCHIAAHQLMDAERRSAKIRHGDA